MVVCPKCKTQYKDHITYCVFCGLDLVPSDKRAASSENNEESNFFQHSHERKQEYQPDHETIIEDDDPYFSYRPGTPPLSLVFAFLGMVSLMGGFIYAIHLWPSSFTMVYGFIPSSNCFPSFLSIMFGIICCCMCFAMAQIISTLKSLEYIIYQMLSKE